MCTKKNSDIAIIGRKINLKKFDKDWLNSWKKHENICYKRCVSKEKIQISNLHVIFWKMSYQTFLQIFHRKMSTMQIKNALIR